MTLGGTTYGSVALGSTIARVVSYTLAPRFDVYTVCDVYMYTDVWEEQLVFNSAVTFLYNFYSEITGLGEQLQRNINMPSDVTLAQNLTAIVPEAMTVVLEINSPVTLDFEFDSKVLD